MQYRNLLSILLGFVFIFASCSPTGESQAAPGSKAALAGDNEEIPLAPTAEIGQAVFAGGCFWCMEGPFEKLEGVYDVYSGYTGGKEPKPLYKNVAAGLTGHAESVLVEYNPVVISYKELLHAYWRSINPTQENGQFYDVGPQYRTAIFYLNEEQRKLAEASKKELEASGKFKDTIAVQIVPPTRFWKAEEYHQDYYLKNPAHYERYRVGSGRAGYLEKVWGKKE